MPSGCIGQVVQLMKTYGCWSTRLQTRKRVATEPSSRRRLGPSAPEPAEGRGAAGATPAHSLCAMHPRHIPSAPQTGIFESQSTLAKPARHCTHFIAIASQCGSLPPDAALQLASSVAALHAVHAPIAHTGFSSGHCSDPAHPASIPPPRSSSQLAQSEE